MSFQYTKVDFLCLKTRNVGHAHDDFVKQLEFELVFPLAANETLVQLELLLAFQTKLKVSEKTNQKTDFNSFNFD